MVYKPIHQVSTVQAIQQHLSKLPQFAAPGPDGLTLVPKPPSDPGSSDAFELGVPERLLLWLRDLTLLRHLPLAFLIPDPQLLPPESIRFFHVDRNWTARLVDGAISAGNFGTVDMTFRLYTLAQLRDVIDDAVDQLVYWEGAEPYDWWSARDKGAPITGMFIRSELVRRWPNLVVDAFHQQGQNPMARVRLLRKDLLSRDLMIVLFAGEPHRVEVKEPTMATRFGVEPRPGGGYRVNLRRVNGTYADEPQNPDVRNFVQIPLKQGRTIDVVALRGRIKSGWANIQTQGPTRPEPGPRDVALNLQQQPYVQVFLKSVAESKGSIIPEVEHPNGVRLRNGNLLRFSGQVHKVLRTAPVRATPMEEND
ncbi:MAG: hypothetical protein R3A51_12765 [Nannocystaceae bacterium]|nr:hypothetical protein [Myxococcales bacterium]